jgi:hypothetical protein
LRYIYYLSKEVPYRSKYLGNAFAIILVNNERCIMLEAVEKLKSGGLKKETSIADDGFSD